MNNNLLTGKQESSFDIFMGKEIEIIARLPVGTHACTFKGLEPEAEKQRVIIKFTKDGKDYKDIRKFNPDKPEVLMFTLSEIARQFGIEGMFRPLDLNQYIDKPLVVYAVIPDGYKNTCYNYKETFIIKAEETKLDESEEF